MPGLSVVRPVLRSFRVLSLNGQNRADALGALMHLAVTQDISFGLVAPMVAQAPLMLVVLIKLEGAAQQAQGGADAATFAGEYEAKFFYAKDVAEAQVNGLLESRDYQYLLVAQAFPLAMTHFRRELQAMGLDARELPLGLADEPSSTT